MSLESLIVLFLSLVLFGALVQSVRWGWSRAAKGRDAGRMLRIKAIAGNGGARYRLGVRYMERSQDVAAFKWLARGAETGNTAAQDAVGMMYELGRGVSKDYEAAARWYQKAAGGGFVDSAVNLGNLYALGRGVKTDYREASRWLEEAAARGGRQAKNSLSWLLATCPDAEIRNGSRAVAVLSPLVNRGERHPVFLDTLAAAYAEMGMFDEARELAGEALAKTDRNGHPELYEQMQKRKGFYETGKPWREPPNGGVLVGGQGAMSPNPPGVPGQSVTIGAQRGSLPPEERAAPAVTPSGEPGIVSAEHGTPQEATADGSTNEPARKSAEEASADERGEPAAEEGEARSHVDYIVEKLLVIEELLRPLKTDDAVASEVSRPTGTMPADEMPESDGSGQPLAPESKGEADLGHRKVTEFADAFVDALLAERYGEIYRKMEKSFRTAVPEDQMGPMLEQMYDAYGGKPIEARLKAEESGYRMHADAGDYVYKFRYALCSTQFEPDAFELFVEILPDENGFVCSSFFITPARKSPGV
jgi:uncharacterized protein